jgi:hypothetical protein
MVFRAGSDFDGYRRATRPDGSKIWQIGSIAASSQNRSRDGRGMAPHPLAQIV